MIRSMPLGPPGFFLAPPAPRSADLSDPVALWRHGSVPPPGQVARAQTRCTAAPALSICAARPSPPPASRAHARRAAPDRDSPAGAIVFSKTLAAVPAPGVL